MIHAAAALNLTEIAVQDIRMLFDMLNEEKFSAVLCLHETRISLVQAV